MKLFFSRNIETQTHQKPDVDVMGPAILGFVNN